MDELNLIDFFYLTHSEEGRSSVVDTGPRADRHIEYLRRQFYWMQ